MRRARTRSAPGRARRAPLLLAAAIAALVAAAPAQAVSIDTGASDLGGNTITENALGAGVVAIDPRFTGFAPVRLRLRLDPEEIGAPLALNALVDNLTGDLWSAFRVELEDARFASIGSARANAGAVQGVATDPLDTQARIDFDPAEPAGLDLGAPLGTGTDWVIELPPGGPGDAFTLIYTPVAVPEPGSLLLTAGGLAALARARPRPRAPRAAAR